MASPKEWFLEKSACFEKYPFISVISLAFLLRLLFLSFLPGLWWDSYIYLGMAKYISSPGTLGIWEVFRPPLHPLVLSIFWKIVPREIFLEWIGIVLDVAWSIGAVILTYFLGLRFLSQTGAAVAALLLGTVPIFLRLTGTILAEPLAMVTALGGLLLFFRREWWSSWAAGFLFGLSFLTRFPQGLFLGGTVLGVLFLSDGWKEKAKKVLLLGFGFILPVIPYIHWISQKYGDILLPFTSGSWIVTTATWMYGSGISYYFLTVFLAFPLLLAAFPGAYLLAKKNKESWALLAIILLNIGYFLLVPRKEPRYLLPIVPLLSIFAAYALASWHRIFQERKKPHLYPQAMVVLCGLLIIIPLISIHVVEPAPPFEEDVAGFIAPRDSILTILSSHPFALSFSPPHEVVLLAGLDYATPIYEQNKGRSGYIYLSDCDFPCSAEDISCQEKRASFFQQVAKENKEVLRKTFSYRTLPLTCTYWLYSSGGKA